MRFWPTYRTLPLYLGFMYLVLAPVQLLGWSHSTHRFRAGAFFTVFLFIVFMSIWQYYAIFWELRPEGLYHCRLFRRWQIPYSDILTVKPKTYWWGEDNYFTIEYDRHTSNPKPRRLLLNPLRRDLFLATLRERAPQADFIADPTFKQPTFHWREAGAACGEHVAAILHPIGRN